MPIAPATQTEALAVKNLALELERSIQDQNEVGMAESMSLILERFERMLRRNQYPTNTRKMLDRLSDDILAYGYTQDLQGQGFGQRVARVAARHARLKTKD